MGRCGAARPGHAGDAARRARVGGHPTAGLQAAGIGRRALVPGRPGTPAVGWPRARREMGAAPAWIG